MTEHATEQGIVVGVDGSEASMAALRWAAQQARALHAEVVAVHAWEPMGPLHASYAPPSARLTVAEQRAQAARLLTSTLRTVFGSRTDGRVRAVLAEGPPARMLLHHAHDAMMLTLGRKPREHYGMGPFGTVGRECLHHATVPVVTVPVADRPAAVDTSARGAVGRSLATRDESDRQFERDIRRLTGSPSVSTVTHEPMHEPVHG